MRHLIGKLLRHTSIMLLAGAGLVTTGIQVANAQSCNPTAIFVFEDSYASCTLHANVGADCYYQCTWKSLLPNTQLAGG
jgi:hypothetical protein